MADESLYDRFTAKLRQYTDIGAARDWLEANQARVMALFDNLSLRDFVLEPIKGVFLVQDGDAERAIRQTITTVAVANMVMAGLPGKLGVGVFVSMALEGWMAWVIASRVGISLRRVSDTSLPWRPCGPLPWPICAGGSATNNWGRPLPRCWGTRGSPWRHG